MSSGYGSRIYRKRGRRWPGPAVLLAILGTGLLIWLGPGKMSRRDAVSDSGVTGDAGPRAVSKAGEDISVRKAINSPREEAGKADSSTREPSETEPDEPRKEVIPDRKSPLDRLNRAREHSRLGQYLKAVEILDTIENPDDQTELLKGRCYYLLMEFEKALSCFQKALLSDPTLFAAKKLKAFALYRLDRFDDSLECVREALLQEPDPELKGLKERVERERNLMKDYADKQTPNFKITFSRTEHGDTKYKVMDILKEAYRTVGREINHYPDGPISVVLYNEQNFFDITRAPGWMGGLFDGKIRIPIGGIQGREELLRRVLFHEFTHALVHDLTASCPLWVNEGLAEYFSGSRPPMVGQIIPLDRLEKRIPFRDTRLIYLAYLESYSAVSHLISEYGMYRIRELLISLGKGTDFPRAFEAVFLISYRNFLQTWGKP